MLSQYSPPPPFLAKTDPEPDELLDEKSGYTYGEFDNDPRMSSISSTYSDNDVKFVMSKIASLEDERFKLLETIDLLKGDNARVSLNSTVETLFLSYVM